MPLSSNPLIELILLDNGQPCVRLSGFWTVRTLANHAIFSQQLRQYFAKPNLIWDMRSVTALDSVGSLLLWQAWGEELPASLQLKPEHLPSFVRWQTQIIDDLSVSNTRGYVRLSREFQQIMTSVVTQSSTFFTLLGQLVLDSLYLLRYPYQMPWLEISQAIYDAGVRALAITALVGFLIGIVLSYLSALQLKMFGAEIYIINILGLSIIRELGPLLAAILVAGRSGSAMTAQIGIMRVTEELDALSAMGISHSQRLVLPKVLSLAIAMPLLSVWTSSMALCGGMFSAQDTLDINYQQFFQRLPDAVPLSNVWIGLGKSMVFGLVIALVACFYGFRIQPNTISLGNQTTNSVVAAITLVIMMDAVFAILFMNIGMP